MESRIISINAKKKYNKESCENNGVLEKFLVS